MPTSQVFVLVFSFPGIRTPWMVQHVVLQAVTEWNTLREGQGKKPLRGSIQILHEVEIPHQGNVVPNVTVKFTVPQKDHVADYYSEALQDLGAVFQALYRLDKPPTVAGFPV